MDLEILDAAEIRRRWPQFQPRDDMIGGFDPMSGVLFPEKCVPAHLDSAVNEGADLRYNEAGQALESRWRGGAGLYRPR